MWYGQYYHVLDNKDRFVLPAKFRDKLETKKFYMTKGLENCLFLFSENIWKEIEEKLRSLSFTKKESRFFNRIYFGNASELEIDLQGRVSIPSYLKKMVNIKKDIVIVGVADRIEIWAQDEWDKFYKMNKKKFEEVAENLF